MNSQRTPVIVTMGDVETALSAWTGIPAERLRPGALHPDTFVRLRRVLAEHVFGQEASIEALAAGLERRYLLPERSARKRPVWNALFAGPSGVGKTELARRLAAEFFVDAGLVRIDCSELSEEHHVARLVGSPPGYVGHGQPGQLIAALERGSHGVILLDEVEKAHPRILTSIVLPLIGEGEVHDMGSGRAVDASNVVVVMTTNLGTGPQEAVVGFLQENPADSNPHERQIRAAIEAHFPREVLGRIDDIILFAPLGREGVERIWGRELTLLEERLAKRAEPIRIRVQPDARDLLLSQIPEAQRTQGARAVMRLFDRAIVDPCLVLLRQGACGASIISIEKTESGGLRYHLVPHEIGDNSEQLH